MRSKKYIYLIFFLLIGLIANIGNEFNNTNSQLKTRTTTTTTKIIDSYVEKQNDLLANKYNINYEELYKEGIRLTPIDDIDKISKKYKELIEWLIL